ncbi:MAG: 16S rRNA (cytosine(1402)-N(4))-methyltransferase RsmH, partial [Phycisphaerae bacterium]
MAPEPGEVVADVTVGLGGHARLLAELIGPEGVLIGLDVDRANLEIAARQLADAPCKVVLECESFINFDAVLDAAGIERVDVLLADLGVSSTQLSDPMRGFSFQHEGPLDMRMDARLETRAVDLVNALRENDLSDLIFHNSQERFSRRIAKRICQARREGRITTTTQLADIVCKAVRVDPASRKSKIHPATRVFQALRMAVNDELGALSTLLEKAPDRLNPGGRFGVVAFHSLEDGLVKRDFRKRKKEGLYEIMTKRPVVADPQERQANPRSRSAKLRVA